MKRATRSLALPAAVLFSTSLAFAQAPAKHSLQRKDGIIAYDDTGGAGAVAIALPGIGEMRGQYRFLRPLFVRAGLRFVTMDTRGQGESTVRWPEYTARATKQDILHLIDELGARRVVLIANSFSAGAVLLAAHDAPDKIAGVVLIGPVVSDEPSSPIVNAAIRLAFASPWATSLWMRFWDSLFPSRRAPDHAAYRDALRANLEQAGRMDVLRDLIALPKSEANGVLDSLRIANLVIMGDKDADFKEPEKTARSLAARLGSQPLIVKGAGHYPHVEFPELVGPPIVSFVEQVAGTSR